MSGDLEERSLRYSATTLPYALVAIASIVTVTTCHDETERRCEDRECRDQCEPIGFDDGACLDGECRCLDVADGDGDVDADVDADLELDADPDVDAHEEADLELDADGDDEECGDELCSDGEDARSCPADCDAVCGDGACTHEENRATCAEDCECFGWQLVDEVAAPGRRRAHGMVFDSEREVVLLFGGADETYLDDTWTWDGAVWAELEPITAPTPRHTFGFAFDRDRGVAVLYGGGQGSGVYLDDTWEWDGAEWHDVTTPDGPGPLSGGSMVYYGALGYTMLYGGADSEGHPNKTWRWDGSVWLDATPTLPEHSPPPRWLCAMAYDEARGVVVMFGGRDTYLEEHYNDTWEWNGAVWTEVTPVGDIPPPRWEHEMVYDEARGVVVMHGGWRADILDWHHDVWEFDGTSWTQTAEGTPQARALPGMAYDPVRQRTVLYGGGNRIGSTWRARSDLWTYDCPPH